MIKGIVCLAENGGLGLNNKLLFHLPKDLAYFKEMTLNKCVVMGRNTFESLPFKNGLPNRKNLVLSSTLRRSYISQDIVWVTSSESVLQLYQTIVLPFEDIWIVGGKIVFEQYEDVIEEWHITRVESSPEADTYYEPNLERFALIDTKDVSSDSLIATVEIWKRIQDS